MSCRAELNEEYALPSLEAVLAGTLALMTGYSQALQADQSPGPRVLMGVKIGRNLDLLSDHPAVTDAFRRVLAGLRQRWLQMSACTELSAAEPLANNANRAGCGTSCAPDLHLALTAPTRLQ
jgi:hypothetical protein